ncbi:MAG: 3-deoxy-manno-octulosonate cytidylyltransferase [Opitutales bacterium]|nr:3-deoxy-manno-octulosonate cytidylyltransferase [Opitutales bacterium]
METAIIVPARLQSTRFPQKLLHEIAGTPVIIHTARRIKEQAPELPLFFAVDHVDLEKALQADGFETVMTDPDLQSGTDRIAQANAEIEADRIINVQGDEPMVLGEQIMQLKDLIEREGIDLATLAHRFEKAEDFYNPNQVKVVMGNNEEALYFSRSPMPYHRDNSGEIDDEWLKNNSAYRHLGLYAYTSSFLEKFPKLPASKLEQIEKLEQLRALENGFRIAVGITHQPSIGIDTAEDAANFEKLLTNP